MEPPPLATIAGISCLRLWKTLVRLRAMTLSQKDASMSPIAP